MNEPRTAWECLPHIYELEAENERLRRESGALRAMLHARDVPEAAIAGVIAAESMDP